MVMLLIYQQHLQIKFTMISQTHLLKKTFNKENEYFVNKGDDKKHTINVEQKIINTEQIYQEQLTRLIRAFDAFNKTPKEFSLLTRKMPIGWTTMSHGTIYNIYNGSLKFNAVQLQEFCRIINIPVMDILEEPNKVNRTEVVFQFNFDRGTCDHIPFNKPRQAIYFDNIKNQDAGMKAIIFRTDGTPRNDTNVCLFNENKKDIFRKAHGREWMVYKDTLLKCAVDGNYYLGKPLEWLDSDKDYSNPDKQDFRCKWQWYKGQKYLKGMWVANWELREETRFSECYPVEVWDLSLRHDDILEDIL